MDIEEVDIEEVDIEEVGGSGDEKVELDVIEEDFFFNRLVSRLVEVAMEAVTLLLAMRELREERIACESKGSTRDRD